MFAMVALAMFTGCSDEPDQEWAEKTYADEKASIDKVLGSIEADYKKFAPVHYDDLPEDPAARAAEEARIKKAREDFDKAALGHLQAYPKLIGWEISYSFPKKDKKPIPYSFDKASSHVPSWKAGTVRAVRRDLKKDGRQLGWGMYQIEGKETKKTLGLKALNYYPGLEVDTSIETDKSQLDIVLFIVPKQDEE
jgi:hypothetical protein